MISNHIDLAAWRHALAVKERIQITDYLQPDAAQRLLDCLVHEVPWTLSLRSAAHGAMTLPTEQYAAMEPAQREQQVLQAQQLAIGQFGFAFETYMMVKNYKLRRDPNHLLHKMIEFLNSAPYLAFCRELTGDPSIRRMDAQATRYGVGHFLKAHNDFDADEGRLYAYVLNLTPTWAADFGGLLQFLDAEGRVVETFMPTFNSLTLFKVPTTHQVSLVAPWAGSASRLAITGWMMR